MPNKKAAKEEIKKQVLEGTAKVDLVAPLPVPTTSFEHYLAEISSYPVLTRDEEKELALRYQKTGDLAAARKLITSNLKFVVKIAHEYKNYGLNPMDIIQEGNIGLMNAVKKFDPTKGYRLISYAVWWIRAYIQNYVIKTWSLVKLGTTQAQRKLFYKLRSAKKGLDITEDRLSSEDFHALAEELGVSEDAVREMDKRMSSKDLSLNAEINEDTTHIEFLSIEEPDQEDILVKAELEDAVKKGLGVALDALKERERYIVVNRLLAEEPMTLEELGSELNLSRERVRQIESAALQKIRVVLEKTGVAG